MEAWPGVCHRCGRAPEFATVAHPLHFKNTISGLGEVRYEPVPFCTNCDAVPSFHGPPIYYDMDPDEWLAKRLRETEEQP